MSAVISRVFMNGNSQAVRIPQEFGLETLRVRISRNEAGDLVIQPLMADRGGALLEALRAFDDEITDDLVARLEADRRSQLPAQDREPLPQATGSHKQWGQVLHKQWGQVLNFAQALAVLASARSSACAAPAMC